MPPRWRVWPRSWPGTSGPGLNGQRITSWTGCSRLKPGLPMKAAGMTATVRRISPPGCARLGRCAISVQISGISEKTSDKSTAPQSLADRLRAGSKALDHDEIAARLAAIRQGREVEERDIAQGLERLHAKELEQEHEAEVQRERGVGHEL